MERGVVIAGPVVADRHPGGRLGQPVAELVVREPGRGVLADVGAIPCSEQHGYV
jgi:hypothetical protein